MIWPFVEANQSFLGLLTSATSILVTIILGVWAVKTVSKRISEHRISARFGFYVNMLGYLELLSLELKKGDKLLSFFFIDQTVRESAFDGFKPVVNKTELDMFSDLCQKFCVFLLSSENNVQPKCAKKLWKINSRKAKKLWAEHQLTLVKFLHKGIGIGSVPYYNEAAIKSETYSGPEKTRAKCDYLSEIRLINDVISSLTLVLKREIGLS